MFCCSNYVCHQLLLSEKYLNTNLSSHAYLSTFTKSNSTVKTTGEIAKKQKQNNSQIQIKIESIATYKNRAEFAVG